jgi:glycosyltransferase involved in cell wall biosynthesis
LRVGIDARELQGRPTGTGRYLRNLLRHWAQGQDDLIAYFDGPPPDDPVLAAGRVEARPVGDGSSRGWRWQELLLPAAAQRDSLDVFFSPAYTCPLRLRVPRVTAVHDLSFFARPDEFSWREGVRRRLWVRASLRVSSRVLACSAFTRSEIATRFPEVAQRVVHVALGPDDDLPPAPARALARERLSARGPLLLSVGTLFHRRCVPELLRALRTLSHAWPEIRLDVVGENRSHPRRDFAALAEDLGIDARVRFAGFVSDAALADCYAAADVAVALSEYEGFGLPALEALARGVPLVAAARPSLDEVAGDAALLVDPRDPGAIAGAVSRLLGDASLRRSLVERGRARTARFSWAEAARRTRAALAEAA